MRNISKAYPGVLANDQISLTVKAGQCHGLIGENGAGKSTLMKIAYGLVRPDEGELLWHGEPVTLNSPAEARRLGIGMVFQHFSLFESLTVADNVALMLPGAWPAARLRDAIEACGERYGLPVDPRRHIHDLSVGERQRVEIIRCLLLEPRLLILDEPTSVLTPQAAEALFVTLRRINAEGTSLLYISHKLHEVQSLCTEATILRGGRVVGQCQPRECSIEALSRLMLGAPPPRPDRQENHTTGEVRLDARRLKAVPLDPFASPVDVEHLQVRAGEIVGVAGVSGNGQNELMDLLSGERLLTPAMRSQANLTMLGTDVLALNVNARQKLGLAFVPEERNGRGSVPTMGLTLNTLLTHREPHLVRAGFVSVRRLREIAVNVISNFGVKTPGPATPAASLSGGNLQKFIVGREIFKQPPLLLVAQPTWGVDVGAAAMIRQALLDLRSQGAAILVVSEDLDELFAISDQLVVMSRGRLSPPVPVAQASVDLIGQLMGGEGFGPTQADAATGEAV